MQRVTLVMSSGKELEFTCEQASCKKSVTSNELSSLTMTGIKGRSFIFIKLDEVAAVLFEEIP